jgi:hypothetical protein
MPKGIPYSEWSEREKEVHRECVRNWRAENPDKVQKANEKQQAKRREQYRNDEVYREERKAASRATPPSVQRERRSKLKNIVFDHYGRICACCGETEEKFLTLGHVNGDGAEHRRSLGMTNNSSSARLWLDIIRRDFPDDFRIECYNCNCGAFRNGGVCPHVKLTAVAPTTDVSTDQLPCAPEAPTTAPGLVN